jgi:hypothetical protein
MRPGRASALSMLAHEHFAISMMGCGSMDLPRCDTNRGAVAQKAKADDWIVL